MTNGIGLYQFTPSTGVTATLSKYIVIDPYNTKSSIRGQAYYIMHIRSRVFKTQQVTIKKKYKTYPAKYVDYCGDNLADIYRYYNGGYWFIYEAGRKQGTPYVCDNTEMRKLCIRGGTYTDKAKTKWLSFCDVNYTYPEKVHKYSQPYKIGADGQRFWYGKKVEKPKEVKPVPKPEPKEEPKKEEQAPIFSFTDWFLTIFEYYTGNL